MKFSSSFPRKKANSTAENKNDTNKTVEITSALPESVVAL